MLGTITLKDFIYTALTAIVLALVVKFFFIGAFTIPSHSMEPTLLAGDYIMVNKVAYTWGTLERGEIVVFYLPDSVQSTSSEALIKRVTALEGDTAYTIEGTPLIVPPKHVFVMGDNSTNSWDSRYWGCLPVDRIVGSPICIYWSYGTSELQPPSIRWNRIFKGIH